MKQNHPHRIGLERTFRQGDNFYQLESVNHFHGMSDDPKPFETAHISPDFMSREQYSAKKGHSSVDHSNSSIESLHSIRSTLSQTIKLSFSEGSQLSTEPETYRRPSSVDEISTDEETFFSSLYLALPAHFNNLRLQDLSFCALELGKAFQKQQQGGWRGRFMIQRLSQVDTAVTGTEASAWIFNNLRNQFNFECQTSADFLVFSLIQYGFLKSKNKCLNIGIRDLSKLYYVELHPDNQLFLNADPSGSQHVMLNPRNPHLLIAEIIKILSLWFIITLKDSPAFDQEPDTSLSGLHSQLQSYLHQLDLCDISCIQSEQEKISFFVNLYNAMYLHAVLELGVCEDPSMTSRIRLCRRAAYRIGTLQFTLHDIEFGILRAQMKLPVLDRTKYRIFFPPRIESTDLRSKYRVSQEDARISFLLCNLAKSGPRLRILKPNTVEQELVRATQCFLKDHVHIFSTGNVNSPSLIIRLPKWFKWYMKDFGKTSDSLLVWLSENHWDMMTRSQIADFTAARAAHISFSDYDWAIDETAVDLVANSSDS